MDLGLGFGASVLLGYRGRRRGKLSRSGALAAVPVGTAAFTCSPVHSAALLSFYLSSSALTRVGAQRKRRAEADYDTAAARSARQVLCNAAFPTATAALSLARAMAPPLEAFDSSGASGIAVDAGGASKFIAAAGRVAGSVLGAIARLSPSDDALALSFVAGYAAMCGDTWSSELGILSVDEPRLVLPPFKVVPRGTNGGISVLGLGAAGAGGAVVGLSAGTAASLLAGPRIPLFGRAPIGDAMSLQNCVLIGLASGLLGSLLDSLLGATLQQTLYCSKEGKVVSRETEGSTVSIISGADVLDNHQVNLVTSIIIGSLVCFAVEKGWIR